ncbi:MAG TPA: hypothetical protein VIQ03_09845, partial [Gammaproteobacteria bacterium]
LLFLGPLYAEERPLKLQSYEPNTIGITKDDNDVSYMDFKLSLMYPVFHQGTPDDVWSSKWVPMPYFAFTGRFGQYINTRDSSPVVSKRFNPKIFGRYWLDKNESYIDIGYAHESNGQRINSEALYLDLRDQYLSNNENPDFANDSISRGWDYWDFAWKQVLNYDERSKPKEIKNRSTSFYLNIKNFSSNGALQGVPEEYNSWELGPVGLPRAYYDGLSFMVKHAVDYKEPDGDRDIYSGYKVAFLYTTGYKDSFENNTYRLETTFKFYDIPIMFWYSRGYNSDLIDYYKDVESYGFAMELRSFIGDI